MAAPLLYVTAMNTKKILVPLDGSPLAEVALRMAIQMAQESPGGSLVLLRAAEALAFAGRDPIEAQVAVVREAEDYLQGIAALVRSEGVPQVTTSVWYGPPAPAIVEAADVMHADVIVMSTHGRSGLGRLFVGSVAESVLRATHIPVLMLRPAGAPVERLTGQPTPAGKETAHV